MSEQPGSPSQARSAASDPRALVDRRAKADVRVVFDHLGGQASANALRAVVDDDNVEIPESLRLKRFERSAQRFAAVQRGDDDRDAGSRQLQMLTRNVIFLS